MKRHFRNWFLAVTFVTALFVTVFATYAWFSSNKKVETGTATARTGEETLQLELSEQGGSRFKDQKTVQITQVNQTDAGTLLPVSSADLETFVSAPVTVAGKAKSFRKVSGEEGLYHGRLYLRASGKGWNAGTRLKLYLEQSDAVLGQASDGMLLHASRLGLKFQAEGQKKQMTILRLSNDKNPDADRAFNTVVDGKTLGEDQVLGYADGSVKAVSDPGASLKDYTVTWGKDTAKIPNKALCTMTLNKIYTLDVYFYLEGCDPDCSSAVSFDAANLHLAFYGMISQEGSR